MEDFFQYLLADIQWSIALKFRGPGTSQHQTPEHLNINTLLDAISVPIVSHQLIAIPAYTNEMLHSLKLIFSHMGYL